METGYRVALVGQSHGARSSRVRGLLENANYSVEICPASPREPGCPAIGGGVCPLGERVDAVVVMCDVPAQGELKPDVCGRALDAPVIVVTEELAVMTPAFHASGATQGPVALLYALQDALLKPTRA